MPILHVLALLALAATPSGPAPLPTADGIVARYVEARGGAERMAAIHSLIYRGTYREGSYTSDRAAMAVMRPYYKLVGDPENPDPDFAEGYDGSAWEYYGDPGIVVRTVGAAAAAARHGLWVDGPLVDYRAKGSTIEVVGKEPIGGRDALRLRITMPWPAPARPAGQAPRSLVSWSPLPAAGPRWPPRAARG